MVDIRNACAKCVKVLAGRVKNVSNAIDFTVPVILHSVSKSTFNRPLSDCSRFSDHSRPMAAKTAPSLHERVDLGTCA
jgi:hypothetical protein